MIAPAECVMCGVAEGPECDDNDEHPGWLCPDCYAKLEESEDAEQGGGA